jgi:ferritin
MSGIGRALLSPERTPSAAYGRYIEAALFADNQYLAWASGYRSLRMTRTARFFYAMADLEHHIVIGATSHLVRTGVKVTIPDVAAPDAQFKLVDQPARLAVEMNNSATRILQEVARRLGEVHGSAHGQFLYESVRHRSLQHVVLGNVRRTLGSGADVSSIEKSLDGLAARTALRFTTQPIPGVVRS